MEIIKKITDPESKKYNLITIKIEKKATENFENSLQYGLYDINQIFDTYDMIKESIEKQNYGTAKEYIECLNWIK